MLPLFTYENKVLLQNLATAVIELQVREEQNSLVLEDLIKFEDDFKEIRQYIEKRFKINSDYIENGKIYFNKYISIAFKRLNNLEQENRNLKQEIKDLKKESLEKFEKLEDKINKLTVKFGDLKIEE